MAKKRKKDLKVGDQFLFLDRLHVALEVIEGDKVIARDVTGYKVAISWVCLGVNEGLSVSRRRLEVMQRLYRHEVPYCERN